MACRSGCDTQDHASWGDCARAANMQIDRHALRVGGRQIEGRKDARLDRYASARRNGLQPRSTNIRDIRAAEEFGGVAPTPVEKAGA